MLEQLNNKTSGIVALKDWSLTPVHYGVIQLERRTNIEEKLSERTKKHLITYKG